MSRPEDVYEIKAEEKFPTEVSNEIFRKVEEKSALAQLVPSEPIPYVGKTEWIMNMGGEASVVAEGTAKSPANGSLNHKIVRPVKVVYQQRITDEFLKMTDEQRVPYMDAFKEAVGDKFLKALDIMGIHGKNPATGETVPSILDNSIWGAVGGDLRYELISEQRPIDAALKTCLRHLDGTCNGIVFSPTAAEMMGAITKENGDPRYTQFDFAFPDEFAGAKSLKAKVVSEYTQPAEEGTCTPLIVLGDFNAFKWGYAQDIDFEIIDSGDPDGQGDLKRYNEIILRAEAYIGFTVLDGDSFEIVGQIEESE